MKGDSLKQRILDKLWYRFKHLFYTQRIADTAIIQNINYTNIRKQKKAVVCYITDSFTKDWDSYNGGRTQPFEILSIVKVLSEADYCIDVIDCNDLKILPFLKDKEYDLIFGFGEVFYQLTQRHKNACSIMYMTEHHPEFADREEKKRLQYFYERHKKKGRIVRSGNFYKKHYFDKLYSHIITLSEVDPFLKDYEQVFSLFPTSIENINYEFNHKNHAATKKHFLWLGSYGAIHKGLDLLLDVFEKRDDIILHIAGLSEEDKQLLKPKNRANIIDHSYINIKTDTFLRVVEACTYIILPSCSEAFSTSVTTGMRHGLIPIVMRDTGFNRMGDIGIFLKDYNIPYLNDKLTELSNESSENLKLRSKKVFDFATENFLLPTFEGNFKSIMNTILNQE